MLKINQFYWQLYKESTEGKKSIEKFEKASQVTFTTDESIALFKEFDPEWFLNVDEEETKEDYFATCFDSVSLFHYDRSVSPRQNAENLIISCYRRNYKAALCEIAPLSFYLYKLNPGYFIPYMFLLRYHYIRQIMEDYDLDVVEVPGKANFEKRCLYYLDICDALNKFRELNGLTGPELCAFIYDMERKSYDAAYAKESNPFPQVWMMGGGKGGKETIAKTMCWEANQETKKGDIVLFYETGITETENKSCFTGIWIAQTDGISDPLFFRYGQAIIGDEIKVKPIPFKVLNSNPKTNRLPRCGAHFCGIRGDAVSLDIYKDFLDFLEQWDHSFNRNQLPSIPEPFSYLVKYEEKGKMKPEEWVEECIIKVFLEEKMRLVYKKDYDRQVHLQMGRAKIEGEKTQDGRTDFSLFPFGHQNKCADVLIESKAIGEMDGRDLEVAFWQAESYASRQYAGLLILADGEKVILYPRKDGVFKFSLPKEEDTYYWKAIFTDADVQAKLRKRILSYRVHSK